MSAFLGPIHYWLYNKIQLQDSWIEDLLDLAEIKENYLLREETYTRYGRAVTKNLADVIDESNIHGWLQEQIKKVEYKLAYVVTELLKKEDATLEEIKDIFRESGRENFEGLDQPVSLPEELYRVVFDYLLEGMPCDHINEVVSMDENQIVWRVTRCIHETYWQEVDGEIGIFYEMRKAWLEGFLEDTHMSYTNTNEGLQRIFRSN